MSTKIDAFLKEHPEYAVSLEGSSYRGKPVYYATGPCMKPTVGREPNVLKALRAAVKEGKASAAKDELREYHCLQKRIEEIQGFLDNWEWKRFTVEDARKCVQHVRDGSGYL